MRCNSRHAQDEETANKNPERKTAAGAPMKEKSRMKTAAKAPPSKNALTMVRGSVRNARSVSTLQQGVK